MDANLDSAHDNAAYSARSSATDLPTQLVRLELSPKGSRKDMKDIRPLDGLSSNVPDDEDESSNLCMICVAKTQETVVSFYKSYKNYIGCGLWVGVACLYAAFLIAGMMLNLQQTYPLVIISVFVGLGVLYYKLLKPLLAPKLAKPWAQYSDLIKRIFDNKWISLFCYGVLLVALAVFLAIDTADNRWRLMSLAGLVVFVLFTFIFSKNPAKVNWRPVVWGLALQFIFGLLILRWSVGAAVFNWLSHQITAFLKYTEAGTSFVYGFLINAPRICGMYPVLAFSVFPTVIFFSSTVSVLYYLGVMQFLVTRMAGLMQFTMGTTAAESMSAAGNIFIGQTEAPLLIKPYMARLTKSELAAVMTGGFATIAGTVFGIYVSFGACANHLLSASVMSAPAALAISKLFYPETKVSKTKTMEDLRLEKSPEKNIIEACANGATSGIYLVANIIANLISFLAFLAFFNSVVGWLGSMVNVQLSFEKICSWIFYPMAYLMGPSQDPEQVRIIAELMGVKTFLNEFIAYQKMGEYIEAGLLTGRSQLIAIYALCGFSNIAAIGVQLGGLGAMAPERKSHLAQMALRCLVAGSVACFMTACVAGLLTNEVGVCVRDAAPTLPCVDLNEVADFLANRTAMAVANLTGLV